MKQRIKGSMTVEAAFLYPYLLLITFWLVMFTADQYMAVNRQASGLYDAVFTERRWEIPDMLRLADTAFDFLAE